MHRRADKAAQPEFVERVLTDDGNDAIAQSKIAQYASGCLHRQQKCRDAVFMNVHVTHQHESRNDLDRLRGTLPGSEGKKGLTQSRRIHRIAKSLLNMRANSRRRWPVASSADLYDGRTVLATVQAIGKACRIPCLPNCVNCENQARGGKGA
jgi:hypothetical protein